MRVLFNPKTKTSNRMIKMFITYYIKTYRDEFEIVQMPLAALGAKEFVLEDLAPKIVQSDLFLEDLIIYRNEHNLILFACEDNGVLKPLYCKDSPLASNFENSAYLLEKELYQNLLQKMTAEIAKSITLSKFEALQGAIC